MLASSTAMGPKYQRRLMEATTDGINGGVRRSTLFKRAKPKAKAARAKVIKGKARVINKGREKVDSRGRATGVASSGIVSATAH